MNRKFYFITHPNVVIDPDIPVPDWSLSDKGRERMTAGLAQPWLRQLSAIYCSTERKAIDSAEILGAALSLPFQAISDLGENDRSSTGFLQPAEFESVADKFFGQPDSSIRGWETAIAAQTRIVKSITTIAEADQSSGNIAIVSHGAVGTLFYCHLQGLPISRRWDQPPNGGGNFYPFEMNPPRGLGHWSPFGST